MSDERRLTDEQEDWFVRLLHGYLSPVVFARLEETSALTDFRISAIVHVALMYADWDQIARDCARVDRLTGGIDE